jgi:transcriptional regulator with XRE-family HTH domain
VQTIRDPRYKRLLAELAKARKYSAITQQELAKKLKKPQSYVSKYESGERRLDIIEFLEICVILKTDYKKILKIAFD